MQNKRLRAYEMFKFSARKSTAAGKNCKIGFHCRIRCYAGLKNLEQCLQ